MWSIFRFHSQIVNIPQIKTFKPARITLDKMGCLILIYLPPNNLFCKVFDNMRSKRELADNKLINLINKKLFLRISQEFIVNRGSFGSRGKNALISSH
jgi:hypothetical protein